MTPTITAFKEAPDRGRGLARDMPVREGFEPSVRVRFITL